MNKYSSNEVPAAVVSRMSLYLRELQQLMNQDIKTISSTKLGGLLGVTDAQVRKDFAYFGQFGYPGIGYRCEELAAEIRGILGTNRTWPAAMVGVGNLGQALLGYGGFAGQGFSVRAAFDINENVVGSEVCGLHVHHIKDMRKIVEESAIQLAILAVPSAAAAAVAEQIVDSGITGVLNFAPVTLNLPKSVSVVGVDLAMELEQLAFAVVNKSEKQ